MQLVEAINNAGSAAKPCEDRYGLGGNGNTAWVIDGATGLAGRNFVAANDDTDASWLAEKLNRFLHDNAEQYGPDLKGLLVSAGQDIRKDYDELASDTPEKPVEYPLAAIQIIHRDGAKITSCSLADCTIVGRTGEMLFVDNGDPEHHKVDAYTRGKMVELQQEGAENLEVMREKILPYIIEGRDLANAPGGYGNFGIAQDFAPYILEHSWGLSGDGHILLMSDGFYALVDIYGCYDDESLLEAVLEHGFEPLYKELRAIEDDDPDALKYPRFKKGDDATAVLLQL